MKTTLVLFSVLCFMFFSCADNSVGNSGTALQHNSTMQKPEPPPLTAISLHLAEYNRNSAHEWCVAFRVFGDNGVPLPAVDNYVWQIDRDANDGVDNWEVPYWSSPGGKSKQMDGNSDPEAPNSRFKVRVLYNGMVTDTWVVGRDMRNEVMTGCTHNCTTDPDSRFNQVQ